MKSGCSELSKDQILTLSCRVSLIVAVLMSIKND